MCLRACHPHLSLVLIKFISRRVIISIWYLLVNYNSLQEVISLPQAQSIYTLIFSIINVSQSGIFVRKKKKKSVQKFEEKHNLRRLFGNKKWKRRIFRINSNNFVANDEKQHNTFQYTWYVNDKRKLWFLNNKKKIIIK